MAKAWSLQDAKSKLTEVIKKAASDGPQLITKRGAETSVVLSYSQYKKLLVTQDSLSTFFRSSPFVGVDVDFSRGPRHPSQSENL